MPLFSAGSVVDLSTALNAALNAAAREARAASVLARRLAALEAADHAAAAAACSAAHAELGSMAPPSMITAYTASYNTPARRAVPWAEIMASPNDLTRRRDGDPKPD